MDFIHVDGLLLYWKRGHRIFASITDVRQRDSHSRGPRHRPATSNKFARRPYRLIQGIATTNRGDTSSCEPAPQDSGPGQVGTVLGENPECVVQPQQPGSRAAYCLPWEFCEESVCRIYPGLLVIPRDSRKWKVSSWYLWQIAMATDFPLNSINFMRKIKSRNI